GTPLTDNFSTSTVNTSNGSIQFVSHGLTTGDGVLYLSNGTLIPGLTDHGVYNIISVDQDHLQFGTTFAAGPVDATSIAGGLGSLTSGISGGSTVTSISTTPLAFTVAGGAS